jgi:hypothetical protein
LVNRKDRPSTGKPAKPKRESKPAWPAERHSGEGSASALETLRKLENRQRLQRPGDPKHNG